MIQAQSSFEFCNRNEDKNSIVGQRYSINPGHRQLDGPQHRISPSG